MQNEKIGKFHAISLIVIATMNKIILSVKQYIISDCASASLINVIYISILALIVISLFCLLAKKFSGKNILDISYYLGGNFLKFIVGIVFIVYFILIAAILLRKLCNWLQIVYYPMTDILFLLTLFAITSILIVRFRSESNIKVSIAIFPLLVLIIILIFIGNLKNYNLTSIYPILGNGVNATFIHGAINIFTFSAISYLYFLPPMLKEPHKFSSVAITSVIISAILLFLTVANILLTFGYSLSSSELFPLYISVRYIEFGTFFQRLDAVFLFFCILNFICFFCLNATICIEILKQITNISDRHISIYPLTATIIGVAILVKTTSALHFLENTIAKWFFFIVGLGLTFVILISANIKYKIFRRS